MIGAWTINAGGRLYGPFTSERMRAFAGEGRLAPHSLVARENSDDWHEARDEPEFSDLFPGVRADRMAIAPERSGNASFSPLAAQSSETPVASPVPAPAGAAGFAALSGRAETKPAAPQTEAPEGRTAHFAIVLDMKSRAPGNLEEAISSLGPAYRLLPNVWIVSTDQSVNAVRNRLVQELGKADCLFVVDASRGKAAWFNFGPEADVRIRRVWAKAS
jgi:hypothetical protein